MMRILGSLAVASLLACSVSAQNEVDSLEPSAWKRSFIFDITTTQTSYSNSWVGGEAGSFNWVANINGNARKQVRPWLEYSTILKVSFGQTYTQNAETRVWQKPQKSTDLIDWESVGRFTTQRFVDPYAAFRIETQFFDGSVPLHRRFFSPLRLTESAGIARRFYEKENDYVTSRFGFGLRQLFKESIVGDTLLLLTADSTLMDGGIESVTDIVLSFHKQLHYVGKLTLYRALFFSESSNAPNDYWKAIDVNWENQLTATITKLVSVNLYAQLLYDKETTKKARIKETLAIGFVLKWL